MKTFTELECWKVGMPLVREVYMLTHSFPREELYGLTSQLRRASSSILANIAEGFGRYTYADKAHKYTIARGECTEVTAFLLIAIELYFVSREKAQKAIDLSDRTGRLLSGLITACKNRS